MYDLVLVGEEGLMSEVIGISAINISFRYTRIRAASDLASPSRRQELHSWHNWVQAF